MVVLTVCYKSGIPFDNDYYVAKHLPLAAEKLRPLGLKREEVRKVVGTPFGTPPPYQIITTLYFDDAAALQHALESADGRAVAADVANFYSETPDFMIAEILE